MAGTAEPAGMAELEFRFLGARVDLESATPTILLRLRIEETTGAQLYAIALRCQIRIEPQRRRYDDSEAEAVRDLFGERTQWSRSLKPLQLAFVSQLVPGFSGVTEVDLPLPASYDFDVAANKYLYGVREGNVPLLLLFSGSVFATGPGGVSVQPVPWHAECTVAMPATVWRDSMAQHFPGTAWLRLGSETFDALHRYRIRHQLLGWDDAVLRLLKESAG